MGISVGLPQEIRSTCPERLFSEHLQSDQATSFSTEAKKRLLMVSVLHLISLLLWGRRQFTSERESFYTHATRTAADINSLILAYWQHPTWGHEFSKACLKQMKSSYSHDNIHSYSMSAQLSGLLVCALMQGRSTVLFVKCVKKL